MRGSRNISEYCERHGWCRAHFGRWRQQLRGDREREVRIALMRQRRRRPPKSYGERVKSYD